jgi:hypothetical protein
MKDFALVISSQKMLTFRQEGDNLLMTIHWPQRPPDVSLGAITTVTLTPEKLAALRSYLNEEGA